MQPYVGYRGIAALASRQLADYELTAWFAVLPQLSFPATNAKRLWERALATTCPP